MANKYTARKMFDEGVAAYVKKDFKTSLDLFSRAIKYDPTLALFFVCRGAASLKLGRAREAIGDFDQAIQMKATYAATPSSNIFLAAYLLAMLLSSDIQTRAKLMNLRRHKMV